MGPPLDPQFCRIVQLISQLINFPHWMKLFCGVNCCHTKMYPASAAAAVYTALHIHWLYSILSYIAVINTLYCLL